MQRDEKTGEIILFKIREAYQWVWVWGSWSFPSASYATDDNDGAAVCKHQPSLQQVVWHTNTTDGKNSAPLPAMLLTKTMVQQFTSTIQLYST